MGDREQPSRGIVLAFRLLLALGCDRDPACTAVNEAGDTLAYTFAQNNSSFALRTLFAARPDAASAKDAEGRTPLVRAASHKAGSAIRALLEASSSTRPIDLLAADRDGRTAFHLVHSDWDKGCDVLRELLEHAQANSQSAVLAAQDAEGQTPLLAAIARGDEQAALLLLNAEDADFDYDTADTKGR
eukprot:tig00020675_g12650.t1